MPGWLAKGCALHRTHQSHGGAPTNGRERNFSGGGPSFQRNALPTATSLPRLGAESPMYLRTTGEVDVESVLLAAPVRRVSSLQAERTAGTAKPTEWCGNGASSGPYPAGVGVQTPQEATDALSGPVQQQGNWTPMTRSDAVTALQNPQPLFPPEPCLAHNPGADPDAPSKQPLHAPGSSAPSDWVPPRSANQQYLPPSPPSTSSAASWTGPPSRFRARGRYGGDGVSTSAPQRQLPPTHPRRHNALISRFLAATNWYELRAVLVSGGGGVDAVELASSPDAVLTVLQRLVAVTGYDMRPHEAAQLGAFLERWLLQNAAALTLMGPAELSLCLHALAKLNRALPAPPAAWAAAWFTAAQPYLLQHGFRPKDVSLSLWAVSRLQLRLPPAALQLLLAAAEPHLLRFNGRDLSQVALALAVLAARSAGSGAAAAPATPLAALLPSASWWDLFLSRCAEVLPECGSQALANLLHGLVRSGMAVPHWLLGDLCAALYGQLPACNPQGLANVLSALALAGYVPEDGWVERFLAESATRMSYSGGGGSGGDSGRVDVEGFGAGGAGGRGCNLDDLTHLAAAAARLELAPPRWWVARLYGAMEQQLPRASPRQLAELLHSVALLHRSLAAVAGAAPSPQPADAGDERGGDGLAAAARPPRSLLAAWHRAAAAALPGFNAIDAAHSLWALAALGERPQPEWLQRLLVNCRGHLAAAPPADLVVLAWSLAALRFRPTWSWLADLVDASEPSLGGMSGQDFAMITGALVRLSCRPKPSWSAAVLEALRAKLPELQERALSQTAWALYRLRVQPPPEWLEALVEELVRRWGARREAEAAWRELGNAGKAGGDGVSDEELRHSVMLVWVVSMWLGEQRRRRWTGAGRRRTPSGLAREGSGNGDSTPSQATVQVAAAGGNSTTETAAAAAAQESASSSRRSCRVSARMLRRRRAAKPGSLVSGLGGDFRAAAAVRRRIADRLWGAAMDATAAALAAGCGTPQDVTLLLAAARRLSSSARSAAAARPRWRQALVAAAVQRLGGVPPAGLLHILGGLAALRLRLEPDGAAAAALAAAPHLTSPHLPAAFKVAQLRQLCGLSVSRLPLPPTSPSLRAEPGAVRMHLGRGSLWQRRWTGRASEVRSGPWEPVLAAGLRSLRLASDAAQPMLQLEVELLKARVRLRKLQGLLGGTQAVAVMRRLAAARAAGMAAGYDGEALAAATAEVRAAMAAAAAIAAAATDGDGDDDAEERYGGISITRWRRSRRVPPLGEDQRAWIRARARRSVVSRLANSSPVLVTQLVELSWQHGLALGDVAPVATTTAAAGATAATAGHVVSFVPLTGPQQLHTASGAACRRASLLWLATATSRCWRAMLPTHRARTARAWRCVLRALPSSVLSSLRRGGSGVEGGSAGETGDAAAAEGSGGHGEDPLGSCAGAALAEELREALPRALLVGRRGPTRGQSRRLGGRG